MNEPQGINQEKGENQMSFKEILAITKEYGVEVLKFSWLIVIFAFLFGKYMRDRKLSSPTTYTAELSFTINEEVTKNQANIASLFGGASTESNNLNIKKLESLISTRKIILKVLFHKIKLQNEEDSSEDYLINHYLRKFYYSGGEAEPFYFKTDSIDPYNRRANYLLKYVHNTISRDHLIVDPTAIMMYLKAVSTSEDFSYELVTAVYQELDAYYSEQALEQKRIFYEMAQERAGQLRGQLDKAEAAYINYVNSNSAEAGGRNNTLIKTQYLSGELKKATNSYFTAVSNMQAAGVAYDQQKKTPSMSVIDPPLYPLDVFTPNPFLHMVVGAILGGGFAFLLIVARKFIKDFMNKEEEVVIEKEEEPVAI